jgi:hypothetical protein
VTDLLAWAGAVLSGVLSLPQAVRAWRGDRLAGVSAATYCLMLANALVWLGFAALTGQPAVGAPALLSGPAAALILLRLWRVNRTRVKNRPAPDPVVAGRDVAGVGG